MWYIFLVIVLWFTAVPAQAQHNLNLALLKKDTQIFESIVNEVLKQSFTNPFSISAEPKGTYLQGWGMVVSFHVNINRAKIRTPWGEIDNPRVGEKTSREEQVRVVKDLMFDCLASYGATIKQLSAHDRISLSAHIEDRNELDPSKSTMVIVMTSTKDDVDLLSMKRINLEEFRRRVQVLEY